MIDRIDGVVGKSHRSEFIREAIDKYLDGKPVNKPVNKSQPKKEKIHVDAMRLATIVNKSDGILTTDAIGQLGWTQTRFAKAERVLLRLDLISSVSGYLYPT